MSENRITTTSNSLNELLRKFAQAETSNYLLRVCVRTIFQLNPNSIFQPESCTRDHGHPLNTLVDPTKVVVGHVCVEAAIYLLNQTLEKQRGIFDNYSSTKVDRANQMGSNYRILFKLRDFLGSGKDVKIDEKIVARVEDYNNLCEGAREFSKQFYEMFNSRGELKKESLNQLQYFSAWVLVYKYFHPDCNVPKDVEEQIKSSKSDFEKEHQNWTKIHKAYRTISELYANGQEELLQPYDSEWTISKLKDRSKVIDIQMKTMMRSKNLGLLEFLKETDELDDEVKDDEAVELVDLIKYCLGGERTNGLFKVVLTVTAKKESVANAVRKTIKLIKRVVNGNLLFTDLEMINHILQIDHEDLNSDLKDNVDVLFMLLKA
eukprot:TRINITY_DN5784_c0_g1_i1.p1 TRINITY_DN5784_c0_g1~~TRINITY_DN5784_c0_g1_i1.p1  ORF type:complete len:377 (-),score=31.31 TRINITY_DN5784_c0_g1_i1:65-1195(-)